MKLTVQQMIKQTEMINYIISDVIKKDKLITQTEINRIISELESRSYENLTRTYNNRLCLNSNSFDKYVEKEIHKLDKAGMFDIRKCAAENQLD